MTTLTPQLLADLFLPLKGRMEKAKIWPQRFFDDIRGNYVLDRESHSWWWKRPDTGGIFCRDDYAASALRCEAEDWLMDQQSVGHIERAMTGDFLVLITEPKDFDSDYWISGPTIYHALAAALGSLLPKEEE